VSQSNNSSSDNRQVNFEGVSQSLVSFELQRTKEGALANRECTLPLD
jgi:hypothetical protein